MDFIVEFIFEFIAELFGEAFFSVVGEIIPIKNSGKAKTIVSVIAIVLTLLLLVFLVIGGAMLFETKGASVWCKVFVLIPTTFLVTGIILKIRRLVNNKRGTK